MLEGAPKPSSLLHSASIAHWKPSSTRCCAVHCPAPAQPAAALCNVDHAAVSQGKLLPTCQQSRSSAGVLHSADTSVHRDVGLLCVQIRLAGLHNGFDGLFAHTLPGQLLLQVSQLHKITCILKDSLLTMPVISSQEGRDTVIAHFQVPFR